MVSRVAMYIAAVVFVVMYLGVAQGQQFDPTPATGAPTAMQHTAVSVSNALYVWGGYDGTSTFPGAMYRYTTAGGWTTLSSVPNTGLPPFAERRDHTAVVSGTDIYYYGGFNFNDGVKNDVWRYNTVADTWHGPFSGTPTYTTSGTAPTARYGHATAISGNNMYVFGGSQSSGTAENDLFRLNVNTGTWTQITPTITGTFTARRDHVMELLPQAKCMGCSSDCLVVHGGYDPVGLQHFADLWRYCIGTNTWSELAIPSPPVRRSEHASFVQNGRLVISGGFNDLFPNDYLNDYWEFDGSVGTWHEVTMSSSYTPRRQHTVTPLDATYTVSFGGTERLVIQNTMHNTTYEPLMCAPGTVSATGYGSCTPCPPGSDASAPGSYNCTQCAPGSYAGSSGTPSCTLCPAGTWGNDTGATTAATCILCPAGTGSGATGASSPATCSPCTPGFNSTAGSAGCFACPLGYFQDQAGQEFCKPCPPGTRCTVAASGPTNCLAGEQQPDYAQTVCLPCSAGQYSTGGAANCTDCGVGFYTPTPGTNATACIQCPAGSYGNGTRMASCNLCPSGTYSTTVQATDISTCSPCGTGTYNPSPGGTSLAACQNCPAGTYMSGTGASVCTNCAAGRYSTAVGASSSGVCSACPAGTENPTPGGNALSVCTDCNAGYYSTGAAAACTACSPGTYNPSTGSTSAGACLTCPASTTSGAGAASCGSCPGGQFALPGSTFCEDCRTNRTAGFEYFNFINDRHFDTLPGGSGPDWFPWNNGYTVDTTQGHTGAGSNPASPRAAAVLNPIFNVQYGIRTGWLFISQSSPWTLIFGGWSRAVNYTGSGPNNNWAIRARVRHSDTSETNHYAQFSVSSGQENQWVHASGFIVPTVPITSIRLFARFGGGGHDADAVYFDDLTLTNASLVVCGCDPGYYQVNDQIGNCEYCPAGQYCDVGTANACPAGQFSFGGASSCESCRPGWVCSSGVGLPCLPDTYHDGAGNCLPCPQDSMCAGGVRQQCGPGTYGKGTHKCEPCIPGTYNNMTGAIQCQNCSAGYISGHKSDHCHKCPEGESSVEGSGVCYSCPEGTYNNVPGAPACSGCPVDTYCDLEGTINPYPCPAGTSTSGLVNRTSAYACT
eukprot:TRINITY_DN6252_c0_g1_i1.p1 TRINITY_DN6252_c0_g1~~TRINITY_DN6252_c0_g1_i1.p1  ORF type:complete len:1118 (+),score=182.13 TRINITY_DN6252_c0_g1_i1:514-3867(+)